MAFEIRPPDEELLQQGAVYGLIDHIEPENPRRGDECDVYFDCVSAAWFDENVNARLFLEACVHAPGSVVRLHTRAGDDPFSLDPTLLTQWLRLYLGRRGDYPLEVEHYASIDHAPLERTLADKFDVPPHPLQSALDRLTSLDSVPDASEAEIQSLLDGLPSDLAVAVYDVGQGSCSALCPPTRPVPQLYFDFGGGVLKNAPTYPKNIRFCFSALPTVVLSHWDWDHWASGQRHETARSMNWIVPRQRLGLQHGKLAAALHAEKKLFIWPDGLRELDFDAGVLQKCTGAPTSRNDTGLAMLVKRRGDPAAEMILLPGDARYSSIPNIEDGRLTGLVMSHHGGKLHDLRIPRPRPGGNLRLGCSYGEDNTFKHPFSATTGAHAEAGWPAFIATADCPGGTRGNLTIPKARGSMPCRGSCTLQPTK